MKYQSIFEELLVEAGITVNGNKPWDIQVHHSKFFEKILFDQELGLGESYMDSWWDCEKLDEFFYRLILVKSQEQLPRILLKNKSFVFLALRNTLKHLKFRLFNYQKKSHAFDLGVHYEAGNDLFSAMLDKELNYTCGYWQDATDLDAAQTAKLQLICEKLQLKPGQRILDVGCGWGGFARFAAKHYQVNVVGITVSRQQKALADELCRGLPIEIRLQDYRDVDEIFDAIVSIGMFEHVGYKNYDIYMHHMNRCLKERGLFLLHTIGSNVSTTYTNEWIDKYIFPHGMLPSIAQIGNACEKYFVMEDWHNFGADYDKTLLAWYQNINQHWPELQSKYTQRFKRMWDYYLLSSAGGFRARNLQLWQIVLSKNGVLGGYKSVR